MNPDFPSRQIGDFQITALSDGSMSASLDLLSGIDKTDAHNIQRHAGINEPGDIHINCYLIRGRDRTILVDAGTGALNNMAGQLIPRLAAVGVSPNDVDTVLLTHCHPDHIGGLLDPARQAVFKHADLMLHSLEAQYWQDNQHIHAGDERRQRNVMLVRHMLEAYAQKIRFFNGDKIADAILPVWLPGHTPGHTGFRIDAEDKGLLIWGDIVHYPHIQSAQPAVSVLFDVDAAQAEKTRKHILEKAVSEKLIVAGMHLSQAGFACIQKEANEYRLSYAER